MKHVRTLSLSDVDAGALDHARELHAALNGLRLEDPPANGDGTGDGTGDGADGGGDPDGGQGGTGDGAGGGQDGGGDGRDPSPLEQQALDAIEALKTAGAEIPDALDKVVREFRDARREAGNHRTAKAAEKQRADQAEQQLTKVLEVLGIEGNGDAPPDPEQLQQTIAERDQKLNAKTVELDAYRAARKVTDPDIAPHGVNPDALLDSASFLARAAKLDPTADTYHADLASAIKDAAEANPLLAAASPGGGRRGPRQGSGSTPPPQPPASLEGAYGQHYNQGG